MQRAALTLFLSASLFAGCKKKEEAKPADPTPVADKGSAATPTPTPTPTPAAGSGSDSGSAAAAGSAAAGSGSATATAGAKKLFIDIHELGKATAADVAAAHKKDLAVEGKYGVDFKAYWVDEKNGKVYCLSEAPNAEAITATHKEAHGLLPKTTLEVTGDNLSWMPTAGKTMFLDVHHLGAGKVTAEAVAEAHKKDLAVQDKHGVKFLDYWVDTATGTVVCLSEASKSDDVVATHKEAHGLLPDTIDKVSEGR